MSTLFLRKSLNRDESLASRYHSRPVRITLLAISAIPVILFLWLFFKYATNVPFGDDYDVLSFYLKFDKLNFAEKLKAIFDQHNEHRIVYTRVVVLLAAFLQNEVNIITWTFIGSMSVVGVCLVAYKSFRPGQYKLLFFLPAVWILFAPFYHNNVFWGMASLQNLGVVFFSLLAIYLVSRPTTRHLWFAIAFSLLATYTSGSGMFASFVGMLILLYQKRHKALLVYGLVMVPAIFLYFYQYHSPEHHPPVLKSISDYPDAALASFFAFLGNAMKLTDNVQLFVMLFTGLLFFIYILYLLQHKYYEQNAALFGMLLYILLVALSASLARAGFGVGTATDSRYSIYSVVLIGLLYLISVERSTQKALPYLFGIALCFSLYFSYKGLRAGKDYANWFSGHLTLTAREWQSGEKDPPDYHNPAEASRMLTVLIREKQYSGIKPQSELSVYEFEGGSPLPDGHTALWANSTIISKPVTLAKGKYSFTIAGYSTTAGDTAAHIKVSVGDKLLTDTFMDKSFLKKEFPLEVSSDTLVRFTIQFDNDATKGQEDRNAFVKAIRIRKAS